MNTFKESRIILFNSSKNMNFIALFLFENYIVSSIIENIFRRCCWSNDIDFWWALGSKLAYFSLIFGPDKIDWTWGEGSGINFFSGTRGKLVILLLGVGSVKKRRFLFDWDAFLLLFLCVLVFEVSCSISDDCLWFGVGYLKVLRC